jgi:hypothetical protein
MVMAYETYLKVNAVQRLIDLTAHEGRVYKSKAYRLCGHGLTEAQFDEVVQGLEKCDDPWLKIVEGPNGGKLLIHLDAWGDNLRQYETR